MLLLVIPFVQRLFYSTYLNETFENMLDAKKNINPKMHGGAVRCCGFLPFTQNTLGQPYLKNLDLSTLFVANTLYLYRIPL